MVVCHVKQTEIWDFDLIVTEMVKIHVHLFTHHEKAKSKYVLVTFKVLSNISDRIRLCHPTNPLLEGDSAAVEMNLIFIYLHMSKNIPFANSPPLSDINFSAALYVCIHELKMALRITSGSLEEITVMIGVW